MVRKAKKKPIADNCISIEKELSKLKLWANLIPLPSFKANLWHIFSKKEWNTIRSAVYRRDENKCTICKRDNIQLNAHEDWIYDYKEGLQKLNKIISLCDLCHNNIHLGYSGSVDDESREKNRQHWCKINDQNEEDFKRYLFTVIVLWSLKNKIQWKVVDSNGVEINHIIKLEDILNSLDLAVDSTTEDLRQIHGIGSKVAKKLRECGIITLNQLIDHENFAELAYRSKTSLSTLNKYKIRAESLVNNEIYQIGPFTIPDEKFIYFDIETDFNSEKIWLIGFEIDGKYTQFYSDIWEQEEEILLKFVKVLKANPKVTLLSFSGTNFDFRVLKKAIERFGMDTRDLTSHRHIDLCTLIKSSFIVPNQSYALKDLGELFKYPFKHTHLDGYAASLKYLTHIEKEEPLEQEILEYGEDDVKVLPFLIETINKGEGIIKKKFSDLTYFDSPTELIEDMNGLTVKVRDFYEEYGNLLIRKDKRDDSFKTEIRFYGRKLKDLEFIRNAMFTLLFRGGSPYQYPSSTRCYIPYYGKDQVIRFIKTIKPRKNNDISKLTT